MQLQSRLSRLEQQATPNAPCTCKTLDIQHRNGVEIVTLPACLHHKRAQPVEVKRLANVSMSDL